LLLAIALVACGSPQQQKPPAPRPALPADGVDAAVAVADADIEGEETIHEDPPPNEDDGDIEYACEDVIRDLAQYPPALADDAPERDWNLAIRGHVLEDDCEHVWTWEDKHCLVKQSPAVCGPKLPNEIVDRLTKLNELGTKIGELRAAPKAITCAKVVAAHYAPIRWQGRLEGFSQKQKNQMISGSRKIMQKTCTADKWGANTRACLVLGGADLCFFDTNIQHDWGYPANGSVGALGIPECDAYDGVMTKLMSCSKVPAHARDTLRKIHDELKANIASAPLADRLKRAPGCGVAITTVENILQTYGC